MLAFRPRAAATIAAAGLIAASACPASSAEPMTLSFSWAGIQGCTEQERSPAFEVMHAPAQTRFLIVALTDPSGHKARGQYVNYPRDGKIEAGAVSYLPPCKPGRYLWTVTAVDRAGNLLGSALDEEQFPYAAAAAGARTR